MCLWGNDTKRCVSEEGIGDLLPLLVMGTKGFCGVFMGMIYFTFSTLPEEVISVDSWARGLELGGI